MARMTYEDYVAEHRGDDYGWGDFSDYLDRLEREGLGSWQGGGDPDTSGGSGDTAGNYPSGGGSTTPPGWTNDVGGIPMDGTSGGGSSGGGGISGGGGSSGGGGGGSSGGGGGSGGGGSGGGGSGGGSMNDLFGDEQGDSPGGAWGGGLTGTTAAGGEDEPRDMHQIEQQRARQAQEAAARQLQELQARYNAAQGSAAQANANLYNQINQGYQVQRITQRNNQDAIAAGYTGLNGTVTNQIRGTQNDLAAAQSITSQGYANLQNGTQDLLQNVGASNAQAIADAYARERGSQAQGLISRGLGNTTVTNAVNRGLTLDEQKALLANQNQVAQLRASSMAQTGLPALGYQGQANSERAQLGQLLAAYQSQIGQAGLSFRNQANQQDTALTRDQLGYVAQVSAPYPNAQQYQGQAASIGSSLQAYLSSLGF